MHLLHKGIPGTEITGTVRRLQRSYATVKSVLPGYLSRAETACGEGISQEIVKERKVQTTNRLGRDMLRAGLRRLSTARFRVCLFHGDNSGRRRQVDCLWWTALGCISAEEGPGELVCQS
jgi:hypothetical protein